MKAQTLEVDRLLTERLILIPFTIQICKNLINNDFSDLVKMGLKKGKGWPDNDVIETLPKIINNLSQVLSPTGFESWMIIKNDTLEIIGDLGFKGFNYAEKNIDIGYGIINQERGKGYAKEATTELIKWAFSKEIVKEITARCLIENTSSINLLKKLNFTETKKDNEMIYWSLFKSQAYRKTDNENKMDSLRIIETFDLNEFKKNELLHLWNNEYPEKLSYRDLTEFDEYLKSLNKLKHLLLIDSNDEISGWAFSFDRDNERWFAIILSEKQQGQGLGRKMLDKLKLSEKELNGWVIDHNNDKKSNGKTYGSPLEFYRKCGFIVESDKRLELEKITAVKIKWTSKNY